MIKAVCALCRCTTCINPTRLPSTMTAGPPNARKPSSCWKYSKWLYAWVSNKTLLTDFSWGSVVVSVVGKWHISNNSTLSMYQVYWWALALLMYYLRIAESLKHATCVYLVVCAVLYYIIHTQCIHNFYILHIVQIAVWLFHHRV